MYTQKQSGNLMIPQIVKRKNIFLTNSCLIGEDNYFITRRMELLEFARYFTEQNLPIIIISREYLSWLGGDQGAIHVIAGNLWGRDSHTGRHMKQQSILFLVMYGKNLLLGTWNTQPITHPNNISLFCMKWKKCKPYLFTPLEIFLIN